MGKTQSCSDSKEMCKKRDTRAKLYFSLLKLPIGWERDLT